jgi:hypothetical protein
MEHAANRNLRFLSSGKIPRIFHREVVEEMEIQFRFAETLKRPKGGDRVIFQKSESLGKSIRAVNRGRAPAPFHFGSRFRRIWVAV